MVTTLGFPVRAGLAHHCQGQSPNSLLVRFISMSFTPSNLYNKYSALFGNIQ